jgi:hypothetical protein
VADAIQRRCILVFSCCCLGVAPSPACFDVSLFAVAAAGGPFFAPMAACGKSFREEKWSVLRTNQSCWSSSSSLWQAFGRSSKAREGVKNCNIMWSHELGRGAPTCHWFAVDFVVVTATDGSCMATSRGRRTKYIFSSLVVVVEVFALVHDGARIFGGRLTNCYIRQGFPDVNTKELTCPCLSLLPKQGKYTWKLA